MADSTARQNDIVELSCDDENQHQSSPRPSYSSLSRFLETYGSPLDCSQPDSDDGLFVFWSQNDRSQNNSSSDDSALESDNIDPWEIHEKIKSAFCIFQEYSCSLDDVLIQFWSHVTTGNRDLLTTYDQPFILRHLDSGRQKCRLRSLEYKYSVGAADTREVEDDPLIISGAPANAFLSHLAEVVMDIRVYKGSPLVPSALECGMMSYFVLPICDDYDEQSRCVGVIECFAKEFDDLLMILLVLEYALTRAFLRTFWGQKYLANKAIGALEDVRAEIREPLERICESQCLTLAQVSIAYKDENIEPFPSSLKDTHMKRMLALKLMAQTLYPEDEDDDLFHFIDYQETCDMLPLRIGEGLAGKALQNHEPHFCRNISEMGNLELSVNLPLIKQHSYLVICLRSIHTGDLDYIFEFLWLGNRNYIRFIEQLISKLKKRLPNFKFASGAQLGDTLHVIRYENCSKSKMVDTIKVSLGKKLSPIPKVSEERRRKEGKGKTEEIQLSPERIKQQFGRTMKEAAKSLRVSESTLKRKCKIHGISEWQGPRKWKGKEKVSYKDQSDLNEDDNRAITGPLAINGDTVIIKAEFANDMIKFRLPLSLTTFEAVEMEIGGKFKLNPGSFKLKYHDEDGDWVLLASNQDMTECINSSRSVNNISIKLCVVQST